MKSEKKSMGRNMIIALSVIAIAIIACVVLIVNKQSEIKLKEAQLTKLNEQYSDLNSMYEERDSLVNDLANTFDEIEANLTFINSKRSQLMIDSKEGAPTKKEEIVADIKLMNTMLEESSKKIEELNKKLKSSGIEINSFKNKIAQLSKDLEEQNTNVQQLTSELEKRNYQIAELDEKVNQLENHISMKEDSLKMKAQIITEKDNKMNTAYFASGTFKELKENGVLQKDGGFLFLGRSDKLKDNFNQDYFTELDTRKTDMFPLFSKKVEIISEHPDSSYSYVYEDDKIAYLKIENPEEFWKVTKYAVVEVK